MLAMKAPDDLEDARPRLMLAVVVAAVDAEHVIDDCLAAITAATAGISTDIIVVSASTDSTIHRARSFPSVRALDAPAGTLVPRLWSRGYSATNSDYVAFTLAQCLVPTTWARRLLDATTAESAGAGGGFTLDPATGPIGWSLFYLRYSAFIDEGWKDGPVTGHIAGDNALYARRAIEACTPFDRDGFWEVEIHEQLRTRGWRLVAASGASAAVRDRPAVRRKARERFQHGRRFGASRVARGERPIRLLAAAPFVPAVLIWRAGCRVCSYSRHWWRFLLALPWMALFASAWAAGEAVGAVQHPAEP